LWLPLTKQKNLSLAEDADHNNGRTLSFDAFDESTFWPHHSSWDGSGLCSIARSRARVLRAARGFGGSSNKKAKALIPWLE